MTEFKDQLDRDRKELEAALSATTEDTIRTAGPVNSIAWLAVVIGAFVLNLLLLVLLTGT
jgi:hypothetical protein